MPSSSHNYHKHKELRNYKTPFSHKYTTQHGYAQRLHVHPNSQSALVGLPAESVTHITSFLDPSSLFALSQTSKIFHEHVADDNTWRRAFFCQFLGISPEDVVDDGPLDITGKTLMLRREESSWKREYVYRWNLRRRWERTKSSSMISHSPVHSAVAGLHLMSTPTTAPILLTSSLGYGVVARSQPLTGKVARGFLDASGTANGFGVGNPNAEFSPNVSQCAISSAGGTARILWAFARGSVAVTVANRAMELGRPPTAQWKRCREQYAHSGAIEHAIWVDGVGNPDRFFITGGADGHVKVWDADSMECLWTSPKKSDQVVRDRCLKVAVSQGTVAAHFESGESVVWSGLTCWSEQVNATCSRTVSMPPPPLLKSTGPYDEPIMTPRKVLAFHLHHDSGTMVSVLTAYHGEAFFRKSTIDLTTGSVEHITFGRESLGAVTALQPVFASADTGYERGFVVVGDLFGYVNVFAWEGTASPSPPDSSDFVPAASVAPLHRFPVFDGRGAAVTCLYWNPVVLVAGSTFGSLKAFDATTFVLLRDFKLSFLRTLVDDSVTHIGVTKDVLVATVDDRVYAWRADPPGNWKPGRGKRVIRMPNGVAKWHQQVEMHRDISESRREMEDELTHTRRAFGREREQHSVHNSLGLNEVEAVEYILMLSRDEEQARRTHSQGPEDNVFGGQFDEDIQTPFITPASFMEGVSCGTSQQARWATPRTPSSLTSSLNTSKIQISPRLRPEPMEAGSSDGVAQSPSPLSSTGPESRPVSMKDQSHFPSISSTPIRRSVSGSPQSARSAWSTPLRSTRSSEGPSSPRGMGSIASSPVSRSPGPAMSLLSARFAGLSADMKATEGGEDEDEELRFALELSLAEARSRGEAV